MNKDEIKTIFDQQAARYDERWKNTAPIRDALLLLLVAVFAELPENARILCVGSGTGSEIDYLAKRFPKWKFTAVEPSGAMLDAFRTKAELGGYADRCQLYEGYLDTLPETEAFDGATCFLVSQFLLEEKARIELFQSIAMRLRAGGILASSDLSCDQTSSEYKSLFMVWANMLLGAGMQPSEIEQLSQVYSKDVGVIAPHLVERFIQQAGFNKPLKFYQAGLIQAWSSRRI